MNYPVLVQKSDERPETERERTARVLEAMETLIREVVRENALLRLSIDRRLGLLEEKLLDQHHGTSTAIPLEIKLRKAKRPPQKTEAQCNTCGATFLRAHPAKVRCDSCTYKVRLAEATARNRRIAAERRAAQSMES